jgi:predicted nucleic acid-binding protein
VRLDEKVYVVDASVGIKLFVPEKDSEKVHWLFARLFEDPPVALYVPDLFFVECANVLWKNVRRGGCPAKHALKSLSDLRSIELLTISTVDLMESALQIACDKGVTVYDACYVALAERVGAPLVTADERLASMIAPGPPIVLTMK